MIKNGAPYKNRSVFFLDFNYNGVDVGILSIWFWALGGWGVGGLKDVDIDIDTCHTQLYSCL